MLYEFPVSLLRLKIQIACKCSIRHDKIHDYLNLRVNERATSIMQRILNGCSFNFHDLIMRASIGERDTMEKQNWADHWTDFFLCLIFIKLRRSTYVVEHGGWRFSLAPINLTDCVKNFSVKKKLENICANRSMILEGIYVRRKFTNLECEIKNHVARHGSGGK